MKKFIETKSYEYIISSKKEDLEEMARMVIQENFGEFSLGVILLELKIELVGLKKIVRYKHL